MDVLYIRCFGHIEININSKLCESRMSRQTGNLLAALSVVNGRPIDRSELANQLWPYLPEQRARSALSTELWRLRQLLTKLGFAESACLRSTKHEIEIDIDTPHHIDISEFLQLTHNLVEQNPETTSVEQLTPFEKAAALYRGEFHEGNLEDWCLIQRQSLEFRYLALLEYLMRANECCCRWLRSIDYANRILCFDPLMESAYRCRMRGHMAHGNKAASIQQYLRCKDQLSHELGVSPSAATEALYRQIIVSSTSSLQPPANSQPVHHPSISAEAIIEIGSAISDLDHARSGLVSISDKLRFH